jgi:hypothetical protein
MVGGAEMLLWTSGACQGRCDPLDLRELTGGALDDALAQCGGGQGSAGR